MSEADLPDDLEDLGPSAKFVYKTLAYEGQLARSEIVEETLLPGRTVGYSVRKLLEADLIAAEPDTSHPQRSVYYIPDDGQ